MALETPIVWVRVHLYTFSQFTLGRAAEQVFVFNRFLQLALIKRFMLAASMILMMDAFMSLLKYSV